MFLSIIAGYNSMVNTAQRLCAGRITYRWLYFFDRPLGFYKRFCPTYQKIEINVVAAIIVFFLSATYLF